MQPLDSTTKSLLTDKYIVLVCQNRTCVKQGAKKVLEAFHKHNIPTYRVTGFGCMGYCGSGPIVRVLPDDVWYCHVLPEEVAAIVEQHLFGGNPIKKMMCSHVVR